MGEAGGQGGGGRAAAAERVQPRRRRVVGPAAGLQEVPRCAGALLYSLSHCSKFSYRSATAWCMSIDRLHAVQMHNTARQCLG